MKTKIESSGTWTLSINFCVDAHKMSVHVCVCACDHRSGIRPNLSKYCNF